MSSQINHLDNAHGGIPMHAVSPGGEIAVDTDVVRVDRGYRGQAAPWISAEASSILSRQQAWNDALTASPLVILDLAVASAAIGAAVLLESLVSPVGLQVSPTLLAGTLLLTVLMQRVHGLYPGCEVTPSIEFRSVLRTCLVVTIGFGAALHFMSPHQFPWAGFAVFAAVLAMGLPMLRINARRPLSRLDWWAQPVLVVGRESQAQRVLDRLNRSRREAIRPLGIVYDSREHWEEGSPDDRQRIHLGPVSELESILVANRTCRVAIADTVTARELDFYRYRGIPHISVPTELPEHPTEATYLREEGEHIELHCRSTITNPHALFTKRALDLGLIIAFSPILLPVIAVIAVAIRMEGRGPILYGQRRVGRYGRPFTAWKFRSMVPNAEQRLRECLDACPKLRAEWEKTHKLKSDPRVTRVGEVLRKTSLDELPQLWNVWVGEMSLVGPRPIVDSPDYDREYIEDHPQVFDLYKLARPGITGLWQISGRNHTSYEKRVDCDRYYLQNWSCMMDLYILWRTVKTAALQEGAY